MMLKKNCILPDHAALSGSSPPGALKELIDRRCGGDKTIVTPCPSPRALVFKGAISWPLLAFLRTPPPTITPAPFVSIWPAFELLVIAASTWMSFLRLYFPIKRAQIQKLKVEKEMWMDETYDYNLAERFQSWSLKFPWTIYLDETKSKTSLSPMTHTLGLSRESECLLNNNFSRREKLSGK